MYGQQHILDNNSSELYLLTILFLLLQYIIFWDAYNIIFIIHLYNYSYFPPTLCLIVLNQILIVKKKLAIIKK